ncbi:MAG: hypothetical protein WBA58_07365 [Giesbergeria sp.]
MSAQQPHSPLHRRLAHGAALLWLLLALVWVPSLGRWHQVAHAHSLAQVHAGHGVAVAPAVATSAFLPPVLADHSLADCLLLDQLSLADAAPSAPPAMAPTAPAVAPAPLPTPGVAQRHVALFHARGPPPQARG